MLEINLKKILPTLIWLALIQRVYSRQWETRGSLFKIVSNFENQENYSDRLSDCLDRVIKLGSRKNVGIFWRHEILAQRVLLVKFCKRAKYDLRLHQYRVWKNETFHYDSVLSKSIIMLDDPEFHQDIKYILTRKNIDRKRNIVIYLSSVLWTNDILLKLSRYLWEFKVANAIFLIKFKTQIRIYTYWPVTPEDCKPANVRLVAKDCTKQTLTMSDVFTRKMRNMSRCPVKASTISIGSSVTVYMENNTRKVRGFEGYLFNTLAETMNFTPVILKPPKSLWGDELHNSSWTGIHGSIKNGIADVGFCQILPMANRLHFEEYSVPITTDSYIWILPEASPINWNKLLVPFKMDVWIYLGVATLAATVFTYCEAMYSKVQLNLLFLWGYFFGQDNGNIHKRDRIMIPCGMWLVFAFFISNAYLASLTKSLTSVIPASNVETVKELLENGVPFGGASTLKNFYKNFEDADDYEIYRRYENVQSSKLIPLFFHIANGSLNFATPTPKRIAMVYKRTGRFHVMNERVLYYHNTFALPRGSPYIEEFNLQIERIKQGGFIDLWLNRNITGLVSNTSSSHSPLRLIHMSSIFTMWVTGLIVSIIAFLMEILYQGYK